MPGGAPLRVVYVIKPRGTGGSRTFSATDTDYEIATGAAKNLCFSLGARRCGIADQAERCANALVYL